MSADRRKRSVLAMIVDDPYRKLVAIGLAVLLWFFIDSRIMASKTLTLPLRSGDQLEQEARRDSSELVVYLPPGRVVAKRFLDGDRVMKNIEVKFSGPRYKIDALSENPPRLDVLTFMDRPWNRVITNPGAGDAPGFSESGIETVEFTAADIARDIRRDDITVELVPARVRLEVEIRDNIVVPITKEIVDFGLQGNDGRLRLDQASFLPREIRLVGPAVGIRKLERMAKKFRAELKYGPLDQEVVAQMFVIDGPELEVYPDGQIPPQITIPLKAERKDYVLTLPLLLRDKRADPTPPYEPDQKSVPVKVSFSGRMGREMMGRDKDARQKWAEQNLRLEVYLSDPISGASYGPVLQLPPSLLTDGPLRDQYPNTECRLEESLTVTVKAKK